MTTRATRPRRRASRSRVHVECAEYTPGMATCAKDVLDLTDSDVLLMAVSYVHGKKNPYRHRLRHRPPRAG